eukprot:PhF_6_TR43397/c1_g1_i1/m.66632/K10394/KIF3A; kinesin family member 3A
MAQRVQVVVRCRPKTNQESGLSTDQIDFDEAKHNIRIKQPGSNTDKVFGFDRVIPPYWNQGETYKNVIEPLLGNVLSGLHTTIFAYGQTGSGKTYTMEGYRYDTSSSSRAPRVALQETPEEQFGIIPRIVRALFDEAQARMAQSDTTPRYRIKCSYLQIYNEKVIDLLNPATSAMSLMNGKKGGGPGSGAVTSGLRVRWAKNDQFFVENLFIFECDTADQVLELFQLGVKNKCMGSHQLNMQSSRSHCIFTVYVHSWDPTVSDGSGDVIKSELTLVDLAGSEKLALLSQNPSQQLLQESIEINASLLALGKVITALADGATGDAQHVPYRDSKLTRLLKHALGGNSVTVMIACINPCDAFLDETMSTLYYAGRARNITNDPRVNEDGKTMLIRQLRQEIQSLKIELQYLRDMGGAGGGEGSSSKTSFLQNYHPGDANSSEIGDKLYEAVKLLESLVQANANLRNAFDKVAEMKRIGDTHISNLNLENATLRERIEMLESIVVNGTDEVSTNSSSSDVGTRRPMPILKPNYFPPTNGGGGGGSQGGGGMPPPSTQPPQARVTRSHSSSRSNPLRQSDSIAARLRMYNDRYRNPKALGNYAQRSANANAKSIPNNMIPDVSSHMIPQSLLMKVGVQNPTTAQPSFGSLAFGGTSHEVASMEQRRLDRLQRAQMLEQQHAMLQQGGAAAAYLRQTSQQQLQQQQQSYQYPQPQQQQHSRR